MAQVSPSSTPGISPRAQYSRRILEDHVIRQYNLRYGWNRTKLPERKIKPPSEDLKGDPKVPPGRICIVGAGMAGLYLAYALIKLGVKELDIFEASDRTGGRVYTQVFPDQTCPHNYYDVGAMRIPKIPSMDP